MDEERRPVEFQIEIVDASGATILELIESTAQARAAAQAAAPAQAQPAPAEEPAPEDAAAAAVPERLELVAEREIVLRCGQASITLTRAGKIILRGTYVLSRSSGVNKIKGGSIQIN